MTEQQLRQELGEAIKSSGIPEGHTAFDLKQKIQVIAKAYADARVAAKDAEIKRLREENESLKRSDYSIRIEAVKGVYSRCALPDDDECDALSPAPVTEGMDSGYCPLCIGTGKEIGVYEVGVCSCRTPLSPKNEDQE